MVTEWSVFSLYSLAATTRFLHCRCSLIIVGYMDRWLGGCVDGCMGEWMDHEWFILVDFRDAYGGMLVTVCGCDYQLCLLAVRS